LSYEEAVVFGSIKSLRRHLARSETEALGYRSIDDLGAYLQTKFNLAVQEQAFWPRVREASYRRNLIVHNRGMVNERYSSKLGEDVKESMLENRPGLRACRKFCRNGIYAVYAYWSRSEAEDKEEDGSPSGGN
jgi:hypothetical protein